MIYEPAEDSYLLSEFVTKLAFGKVLDIGTGSGIQAIEALKLKKVKSVVAADISNEVVNNFKNKIKNSSKKLKIIKSDLFSNIKERFDTIIFNPPYLPRDKREPIDSQLATTGGKHGYETLQKFIIDLNDHLTKNGFALIVFSSLTNKEKVDEFIITSGFTFDLLKEEKVSFETLYCYKINRNWLLTELFNKNITNVHELMEGHRGIVFTGIYRNKKVAIKSQRLDVKISTIDREANVISKLNKYKLAPKLILKGRNYFVYEFAEGELSIDYLKHISKSETKKLFLEVLRQCRVLDKIHITKEEMTNPYKHIIIDKKVVLIDFERAHYDTYPANVTQFCQYIMKHKDIFKVNNEKLIELTKQYKSKQTEENYTKIKKLILTL
ncbi:MAG: HemK2/MTQ2 family protein methyltransferase [Nanoarchaeota archaeon]|mgnify:CR=1 FL=1